MRAAIDPGRQSRVLPRIPGATLYDTASYRQTTLRENTHIPFLVSTEPTIVTESETSKRTRRREKASVVEENTQGDGEDGREKLEVSRRR